MGEIELYYRDSTARYPALDGLRGFALVGVVLCHVLHFTIGWVGLDLFFVLSGFLVTSILLDSKEQDGYFRNFYVKRALRILPLYYLVLFLFFVPYLVSGKAQLARLALPYLLYFQNLVFTLQGHWPEGFLAPLNHFWSLAVEIQFYLLFPLLIYVTPRRALPVVCLWLIALTLGCRLFFFYHLRNPIGCYVFPFCRTDTLFAGALTCLYVRRYKSIRIDVLVLAIIPTLVLMCTTPDFQSTNYLTFGYTLNAVMASSILLLCLSPGRWVAHLLGNSIMRHLGKYSYGIYAFHHVYLYLIDYALTGRHRGASHGQPLIAALTLTASYVSALVSFNLYERPIQTLRMRLLATR